ncbi:hypothetical protein Btru_012357 [Bulinus truncatus]|nr:hypothetical protein Btru_012357 [Bulinus truncatus]
MSSCDHFTQNAWRPDLCSTCQRAKSEHESGTGSRSSWRRRSEPNPNNTITGVRISALASKFQTQDTGSNGCQEDDIIRARTLDRKYARQKSAEKKLSVSRSTDLLDGTLSSSAITLTVASHNPVIERTTTNSPLRPERQQSSESAKRTAGATQPLKTSSLKSNSPCGTRSNQQGTTVTDSSANSSFSTSSAGVVPLSRSSKPNIRSTTKLSSISSPPAKVESQTPVLSSALKSVKSEEGSRKSRPRKVNIPEAEPELIGTDGGLDNLYPEDEAIRASDETDNINLSLTDEEKEFTLLALGNTVWNSDTRNLQVELESSKRSCREFEDLQGDELLVKERFKSLVDCDATKHSKNFGTFPKSSALKHLKVPLESVQFEGQSEQGEPTKRKGMILSNGQKSTCQTHSNVERLKSVGSSGTSMTSLSSDIDWKGSYGSSSGSGDSGVDMGSGARMAGDVKDKKSSLMDDYQHDSVYECPDEVLHTKPGDGSSFNFDSAAKNLELSQSDFSTMESLQAIALLNDVLKDYGDFNESSTDDFDPKDVKKECLKGKKSSDFEAKMASLAANLDLSKQQQRKRQAPRPPVSPPPEPNLASAVSPKKVLNQPDPVFKMVTVGKSIVSLPPQQDIPKPNKPSQAPLGLEEFVLSPENGDGKSNGETKGKKGITSFFRNILRRGKDSSESFESQNPDVQLLAKVERKGSINSPVSGGSLDIPDEEPSSSAEKKSGSKPSQQSKHLIISAGLQNSTLQKSETALADGTTYSNPDHQTVISIVASSSSAAASGTTSPVSASPPTQRKKGLASPKMMLRKATAKFSPPASRHQPKPSDKESSEASAVTLPTALKPYPAPKPAVPPPSKPPVPSLTSSSASLDTVVKEEPVKDKEGVPSVVKRRSKSPKRNAPPIPPSRTSVGQSAAKSAEARNMDLSKELEWRLSKAAEQTGTGTLSRTETRESTRRSLPVPPSPPGDRKEKTSAGHSSPISPIHETENSAPSSPSSPVGGSFDFVNSTEWSGGSTSTIDEELPKFTQKVELPTVANPGRKGFLGKLGGNRKNRAPQPPSVKRAKSITESSTLPRGEKKNKKINAADISGPVIVTDVSNVRVLENRRNTISLGEDPNFHAVIVASGPQASTASVDKSGFDEFDFPVLSPLGSLENLYESILPKPDGTLFHYYDPPTSPKVLCPNIPADGYLEPVPPLAYLSAAPSVKSPMKAKGSIGKVDSQRFASGDSSTSESAQSYSSNSSQSNSTENSGSSLPDTSVVKLGSNMSSTKNTSTSGVGPEFVEPEMTEQRRILLASQPIYEEIPNGNNEDDDLREDVLIQPPISKEGIKKTGSVESGSSLQKVMLPGLVAGSEMTKSQIAHAWLQQPHVTGAHLPQVPSSSTSPSHVSSKHNPAPTTLQLSSMTSSQISFSSLMTSSMTSSMLPPPPPPPDHLPAPAASASRSVSKETVSSESDSQSNCSTLSRPRPVPRRRPKRPDTGGSDQYVSMNRPNAQVSLNEEKLRDVFTKVTSITFHALQDIYVQCEKMLSLDKLDIPNPNALKWADFDIYGQPLHASGRCIVYNAKLRINSSHCQVMVLHSRPATERCTTSHPSLLRPSAVFADTIPFSYLTPDFIKTSQLLQNSVYDSSQARCFVAVGSFDVVESLDSHLALLRETLALDPGAYLNVILTAALQLLSAMSHCLDQGFSVTETDYNDVFLITRSDLRGKVVAFLPHQRSLDVPQGEAMCNFLDRLLVDAMPRGEDDDDDIDDEEDDGDDDDDDGEKIISAPKKVVAKLRSMLEPRRVECLGQVRTAVEYILWGPSTSELPLSPMGAMSKPGLSLASSSTGSGASREQELYVWLEKERVVTVGRLARNLSGLGSGLSLEEFYTLKFLLKSSAACLAESLRRLTR